MTQAGLSVQYCAEMPFSAMHAMDERVHLVGLRDFLILQRKR